MDALEPAVLKTNANRAASAPLSVLDWLLAAMNIGPVAGLLWFEFVARQTLIFEYRHFGGNIDVTDWVLWSHPAPVGAAVLLLIAGAGTTVRIEANAVLGRLVLAVGALLGLLLLAATLEAACLPWFTLGDTYSPPAVCRLIPRPRLPPAVK